MDASLFDRHQNARARGLKQEAAELLQAFVASFTSAGEREAWTRDYLANRTDDGKLSHVLFEQIIFPVLREGYRRSDPWCLLSLARCAQNLYSAKALWAEVDYKTPIRFIETIVDADPGHAEARQRLLEHLIDGFKYSEHEWPAGILFGMDGASTDECRLIYANIARARTLDLQGVHTEYLDRYEDKVREYLARLSSWRV